MTKNEAKNILENATIFYIAPDGNRLKNEALEMALKALSSNGDLNDDVAANPSRHTGRWVQISREYDNYNLWWYECSKCGEKPPYDRYGNRNWLTNYCPICGAKMEVE